MSVSFLILANKGADWLRHTLPRTKKAFPASEIVVVTTSDDQQTIALASAFKTVLVTVDPSVVTANESKFNYAALVRAGQAKLLDMKAEWIIATRANVAVDESIAAINVANLDKTAVYGCFFTAFDKPVDLLRYVGQIPSSSDVRNFVPRSEFMMFHTASGNRFGMWSPDTKTGEDDFSSKFTMQYMIQTKLAHLGTLARDTDVRTSPEWVSADKAPHIAPVHPGAIENKEAEKREAEKAEKEEPKPELKPELKPEPKPELKPEEVKADLKAELKAELIAELKAELKSEDKPEVKPEEPKPEEPKPEEPIPEPIPEPNKKQKPVGRVIAPVSNTLHKRFGALQSNIPSLPVGRREVDTQQLGRGAAKDVVPLHKPAVKHKHFKPIDPLR